MKNTNYIQFLAIIFLLYIPVFSQQKFDVKKMNQLFDLSDFEVRNISDQSKVEVYIAIK